MAHFNIREFKTQASSLLREKVKNARLVLTNVSRIQLLTEEATNADPWGPETRSMAMLSDAAFELEEYERIVQVLHSRLSPNVKSPWRQFYKTLVVLEYLLTHGPASLANEFMANTACIEELCQYQFIDQKGIDRGISVRNKADRVLDLLTKADHWKEERNRTQKISRGICGFGSTNEQAPLTAETDEIKAFSTSKLVNGESGSFLSSTIGYQQASAGELKLFEKCISDSWHGVEVGNDDGDERSSSNHDSVSEHDQSNCVLYTKSLSSPSRFRDTSGMPCHARAADGSKDNLPEQENKEISNKVVDSILRKDGETSPLLHQRFGETDKVAAPANFSLRHFCGIHRVVKETPLKDGAISSSNPSHPKEVHNVNPNAENIAEDAKKEVSKVGKSSKLPRLPPPPRPKFRARFQHHCQSSNLIDL